MEKNLQRIQFEDDNGNRPQPDRLMREPVDPFFQETLMPISTIRVAAAVIIRSDGRFLLASRPAGKPHPGYWEFPGGKIEDGESPFTAVVRELNEELGIRVTSAHPWITCRHDYSDARVILNFFRVYAWHGKPQPREGQTLAWQTADNVTVTPILPANQAILRALRLPPIMGITQAANDPAAFLQKLDRALKNGLGLIQVREKGLKNPEEFALTVNVRARAAGARVIINGDERLAKQIDADGIQLTSAKLTELHRRPDFRLVGASCHNAEELDRAERLGCDYALLSPVLPTASHPDANPLGWKRFAELCADRCIPVYALGGLTVDDLPMAQRHGAHGVALLRGAWQ